MFLYRTDRASRPADQLGMNQREMNRATRLPGCVLHAHTYLVQYRSKRAPLGRTSSRGGEGQRAVIRAGAGRPHSLHKTGLWLDCSPYQPVVVRGRRAAAAANLPTLPRRVPRPGELLPTAYRYLYMMRCMCVTHCLQELSKVVALLLLPNLAALFLLQRKARKS